VERKAAGALEALLASRGLDPDRTLGRVAGLAPDLRLVVGTGVTREEVKVLLLARGLGFTGAAVVGVEELALELISLLPAEGDPASGFRVAQAPFRQEVLRHLLDRSAVARYLPELDRLRRQTPFFRRLDRALQAGRLAFASPDELEVMENALLQESRGSASPVNPLRHELKLISAAFEAWLRGNGWLDPVMLLREACARIDEAVAGGVAEGLISQEFLIFSAGRPDPAVAVFFETLARLTRVTRLEPGTEGRGSRGSRSLPLEWKWSRAHTLDDAAEFLARELGSRVTKEADWNALSDIALLIPDQPEVRRALLAALNRNGLPLEDPRDPTRLRLEESVKQALLPLEMVASRFERDRVLAWLGTRGTSLLPQEDIAALSREIVRRGVRDGLESYRGGKLEFLHRTLAGLASRYAGRFTCAELAALHLGELTALEERDAWLSGFFESQWKVFAEDISWLDRDRDEGARRMPLLAWLERLRLRLQDAAPPAAIASTPDGVRLYRLNQFATFEAREVILFGFPAEWLTGEGGQGAGDYFFSRRERERLALDFPIRSLESIRNDRRGALESWFAPARRCEVWDAEFDWDGAERAGIWPALRELGFPPDSGSRDGEARPLELGAHPRWLAGFSSHRLKPVARVRLPVTKSGAAGEPGTLTASQLEAQSRCAFVGLAQGRWRLDDIKMPGPSLWPEERGKLLHEAVRLLMASRTEEGALSLSSEQALDAAWTANPPRGLLPSRRFRENARRGMIRVLEAFCEVESQWQARARTTPVALDQEEIRYATDDYIISGRPDRVDEWNGHLIVMDYKTGSANPTGRDVLETGTRLQMPFYGLAARDHWKKPVAATQFVVLGRDNDRSRGLFFEPFVDTSVARKKQEAAGSEVQKPFKFSSRNGSIIRLPLEEGWEILRTQVDRTARAYLSGYHDPQPRLADECESCRFSDLCGWARAGGPPAALQGDSPEPGRVRAAGGAE